MMTPTYFVAMIVRKFVLGLRLTRGLGDYHRTGEDLSKEKLVVLTSMDLSLK